LKYAAVICVFLLIILSACQPAEPQPVFTPSAEATASPIPLPAAAPTSAPAATEAKIPIEFNRLKNFSYQFLITGPAALENGVAVQGDTTITLLDLYATGDLNSDGQDDVAVLIQETYGGAKNVDLVVLLNKNGQPVEAAGESLYGGTQVQGLRIEKDQIFVDTKISSAVVDAPCCSRYYSLTYLLSGQRLLLASQATQTAAGEIRSIKIEPSLPGLVSSDSLVIKGRFTIPPFDNKLFYIVTDSNGSEVSSGESVIPPSNGGDFSMPIDLSWVSTGPVRIEIRDAYATSHVYAVLASASALVDFKPPVRPILPPLFASIKMIDEQYGWALSPGLDGVLRTTDGGQTWQKSVFPDKTSVVDLYALDRSNAFVLSNLQNVPQNLYRTTDGAETWTKLPTSFREAFLQFHDVNLGWAVANSNCGAGTCVVDLYQTVDSGQTWQKMDMTALHSPGEKLLPEQVHISTSGFAFLNPSTIWLGGNQIASEKAIHLLVSHTGGKSWLKKEIPVPEGDETGMVSYTPPVFTNDQDGYIVASYSIPGKEKDSFLDMAVLMLTHNGGETWNPSMLPIIDALTLNVQMLSAENILIWNQDAVYTTLDAGQTWNPAGMNLSFPGRLASMQFLSAQIGFALVNDHNPNAFSTNLYKTIDGGQTWQKVDVRITP
jgi:hypothetical protein